MDWNADVVIPERRSSRLCCGALLRLLKPDPEKWQDLYFSLTCFYRLFRRDRQSIGIGKDGSARAAWEAGES